MRRNFRATLTWIEHRTGLETAIRSILLDDIPGSAGWPQVFGSVALFLFLIQAVTGVLLSFNFAATPGEAYNSLSYIIRELTAGRMIRGLHHWGSSLMVIVVTVHMAQVFLYGAYKKPREATWMVGVILLLFTFAFGLTGYLLPWDNRAYWGTVVTTRIMGEAPLLGRYLQELLGAENGVGVVTFSRFYSLHTLLLPVAMMAMIGVHIVLVRRHGVTPAAFDDKPSRKFFPDQAFRDVVAVFIVFLILFLAAALVRVPLERLADPTDPSYIPRPEWYFLFLFQTLKFFPGALEPIGSVILPTMGVIALFAVPFIDRSRVCAVRNRVGALSVIALTLASWSALTAAALKSTPGSATPSSSSKNSEPPVLYSAEEIAGFGYFRQERCETCHNLVDGEPKTGPNLMGEGRRRTADWMIQHFKNPSQMLPGSNMPPIHLAMPELDALSSFLLKFTPDTVRDLENLPASSIEGAQIFVANLCGSCHSVNGSGGGVGPSLNGLASRRSALWIHEHFATPQKMSPGSVMPPYHLPSVEEQKLISYLLTLP